MVVSLIGPIESPFVQRTLLVAAYAGIKLKLVPITIGEENETEEYRLNCHPMQRVPVMKTDEGYLFESNAMIRYLARTEVMLVTGATSTDGTGASGSNEKIPHPQYPVPYAMYGHSLLESTAVDSWLDFAITHLDAYTKPLFIHARFGGAPPPASVREKLFKALTGLEERLILIKEMRRLQLRQSGAMSARTAMTDEELLWGEEEYMSTRAARDSRLSSVYNVAGSIRHRTSEKERQERERQLDSIRRTTDEALGGAEDDSRFSRRPTTARDSMITPRMTVMSTMTPRASVFMSARGSVMGGSAAGSPMVQRQDLLFLVGDSLTAADLVMAMAVHGVLSVPDLRQDVVAQFPGAFRYYKSILTLPVAAEVGKALRVNVVKA